MRRSIFEDLIRSLIEHGLDGDAVVIDAARGLHNFVHDTCPHDMPRVGAIVLTGKDPDDQPETPY